MCTYLNNLLGCFVWHCRQHVSNMLYKVPLRNSTEKSKLKIPMVWCDYNMCYVIHMFISILLCDSSKSLQIFAHTVTAHLSWYVQNFVAITSLEVVWETKLPLNTWTHDVKKKGEKSLVKWAHELLMTPHVLHLFGVVCCQYDPDLLWMSNMWVCTSSYIFLW